MAMGVKSRNRFKETSSKKLHNLVTDYLDVEGEGEGGVYVDFHVSDLGNCAVATANSKQTKQGSSGGGASWGAEDVLGFGLDSE